MPSSPKNAKGLLAASIQDPNPVIFLGYRWLHNIEGEVPESRYFSEIGKPEIGGSKDFTVVASSLMVTEALAGRASRENGIGGKSLM